MQMDQVKNYAIRLALRATETTLIPALQYKSQIPSLFVGKKQLAQQHMLKAFANQKTLTLKPYLSI